MSNRFKDSFIEYDNGKIFNAEKTAIDIVRWVKNWFNENGKDCNAIIGISGGKDSSIVAKICVEALGKDRVIGIIMPQDEQNDIAYSYDIVKHLGIKSYEVNVGVAVYDILSSVKGAINNDLTEQSVVNAPPRVRMALLYAFSQNLNGRVANTCNLSEDYVGYATRYGDSAGDFSPLSDFTVREVKAIGRALGLPDKFIEKVPSDGLCGKTDEDNLGFTYEVLDTYIRTGKCDNEDVKKLINFLHEKNLFKLKPIPKFKI